ncbi:MAG: beta-ketoacyl-ACP synthase II [Desulfotalea sp.]
MKRRVVITGLGLVTPLGTGVQKTWDNICAGKSGVDLITRFDASNFPSKIAAEVKDFQADDFFDKKTAKHIDLFVQYALAAASMAMEDCGFEVTDENCGRIGVGVGCGMGSLPMIEKNHKLCLDRGPKRMSPYFIPMTVPNMPAGQISMAIGSKGPNLAYSTACAAGTHAVGEAFEYIRSGRCDVMLAGGAESVICPTGVGGFSAIKALSTRNDDPSKASRPFDKDRDGFVIGEGAGIIVLEDYDHAIARGAKIYAEMAGYGLSSDAYHITAPPEDGEGAVRAMRMAIEDSGVSLEHFDYINAHGTSTYLNDKCETTAIKTVFGEHAKKLAISSTKSMLGHSLGATGGVEAALMALSLYHQYAPPTVNLDEAGPECDLDYVANVGRQMEMKFALSNSFGFGGTNGVVAMKKFEK